MSTFGATIVEWKSNFSIQFVSVETNSDERNELKVCKRIEKREENIYTFDSIKLLVLYIGERPIQLNQMIQFSVNWQWDSRSLEHIVHAIGKNVYSFECEESTQVDSNKSSTAVWFTSWWVKLFVAVFSFLSFLLINSINNDMHQQYSKQSNRISSIWRVSH